jgi:hypothetical protein
MIDPSGDMSPSGTPSPSSSSRWIILVARGQHDLFEHLVRAFQFDSQVEVVMDRRKDLHQNPSRVVAALQFGGAAVIRREP